ncbi:lytic transglycosylase domain-containing protein [Rhizobium sp. L1K21]|uniref:lytic transglycosylase domain-containing protein n=1 Tax=Rhizobium sp. L1K21 TaxID=2954933 RepID=UPI002092BFB1|nr:lytic transglycosylase domain-containing protein [Rhizobium sp. L1K21]MCO6186614.1 lytic transglycosylase domain-containing protein [Rhizobium sp. L1K21]
MVPSVSLIFAGALGGWLLAGGMLDDTTRQAQIAETSKASPEKTGSIPVTLQAMPNRLAVFRDGMSAFKSGAMADAISARNTLLRGDIHRDTLTYLIAMSGARDVPSSEFEGARRELSGWPGIEKTRAAYERALYREHPSAEQVLSAFKTIQPETSEGRILLARALHESGEDDTAKALILPLWSGEVLTRWQEGEVLDYLGDLLRPQDHLARMNYLLYRDRISQATRFAKLASAKPLFDAWSAVIRGHKDAAKLLKDAEKDFKGTAPLKFANILYLQKQDKYDDAANLLDAVTDAEESAISPGEWWNERRIISRGLYEAGDIKRAYALVAAHHAKTPQDIADAEFHAGWYALRGLNDSEKATAHFRRLLEVSTLPSSRSRALYWLGRAEEEKNPQAAKAHLEEATVYGGNFYGQLAAARLKKPLSAEPPKPSPPPAMQGFEEIPAMKAIGLLEENGFHDQARRLYSELADQTNSGELLEALAARAEAQHDSALALAVGKTAYYKGLAPFSVAFPVTAISSAAGLSPEERALSLAIARQESGFNGTAVSPVDARGLMQVMPGTAKEISARLGLAYAPEKLTADDAYNALLGSKYAGEQIRRHEGSYILTFAAYNAGPGRVKEWLARFGDPRGRPTDEVVDWIEMIPYPETRFYVQRVMENFEVYKMRFGLPAEIDKDISARN